MSKSDRVADKAEVTIDVKAKTLTIVLPLETPTESKSGKSLTIASTRGIMKSDATYNGKQVNIGVNAFISAKE